MTGEPDMSLADFDEVGMPPLHSLRPHDETEAKRLVIVRSIVGMKQRELSSLRATLGLGGRRRSKVGVEAVGWSAAFHELPFSMSVNTGEGKIQVADVVFQVSSADGSFLYKATTGRLWAEWRDSESPNLAPLEVIQKLIDEAHNWYPSLFRYMSGASVSAARILERGRLHSIEDALRIILRRDNDLLRRVLPDHVQELSLKDIRVSAALAERIGGSNSGRRPRVPTTSYVDSLAKTLALNLIERESVVGKGASVGELLGGKGEQSE